MSVYNGFANRAIETTYTKALYNLTFLMQLQITKIFKGGKYVQFLGKITVITIEKIITEQVFARYFEKLYAKLHALDNQKYLPPKYSYALKGLAEQLGVYNHHSTDKVLSNNSFDSTNKIQEQ